MLVAAAALAALYPSDTSSVGSEPISKGMTGGAVSFNDIEVSRDGERGVAVGPSGTLLTLVEGAWQQRESPTHSELRRALLTQRGGAYAVGSKGAIVSSSDNLAYTCLASGTTVTLTDIAVSEDGGRVWISGFDGTLLTRDVSGGMRRVAVTGSGDEEIAANYLGIALNGDEVWLVSDNALVVHGNEERGFEVASLAERVAGKLNRIVFHDGQGWILGESIVLRLVDGVWKSVTPQGGSGQFDELGFSKDGKRVWVSGRSLGRPMLFVSDDRGFSWQEQPLPGNAGVIEVDDVSAHGVVEGWAGTSGIFSTLGGKTLWSK